MALPVASIERLAFGGNGVCRIDGKVCFVPYSCPGDHASIRITTEKKSYSLGSLAELREPSPFRVIPECPLFGQCGGCHWQHISYEVQCEQKRNILAECLRKGARIAADCVEETVAAPHRYGYRSRVQFKVGVSSGRLLIGFFRHASHGVVDAPTGCPVALPVVNELLARCRCELPGCPGFETFTQLTIDAGENGVVLVIHDRGELSAGKRRYLADPARDFGPCSGLLLAAEDGSGSKKIRGDGEVCYSLAAASGGASLSLAYPSGGFAQVNRLQNSAMVSLVTRLAACHPTETLLDLYCGNGNFSLPLASEVAKVTGIESNAEACRAATANAEINKVANVEFICDDAATGVSRLLRLGRTFDVVLLDPPRAGAGEVLSGIVTLQPERIIYVSCDPSTLARDCERLMVGGYRVVSSVPLDMFPQTYHIESITLLGKAGKGDVT